VKIVLLSHGNHSGDFLHLLSKPLGKKWIFRKWMDRYRLGNLIATESDFRVKWLDAVVALSETEKQIENWYGAKRVSFLPRRLYSDFLEIQPVSGRIGFVGRLDHPPNLQGLTLLLEEFSRRGIKPEFRLVGAPSKYGAGIQRQFPFVNYLGELSDQDLENELKTWAFFTNPVWWYSTGSSTKLARAISWGLPIITSSAGMRGYEWKTGSLLVTDSPASMAEELINQSSDPGRINYWKEQTRMVATSGLAEADLARRIQYTYQ
jgi:glycosyltransferase involved in cell wall biosynthesis